MCQLSTIWLTLFLRDRWLREWNKMQVSVRKAALGVIAALLKTLPGQAAPAQLWVTSALPMVRDVEASLQEQLLDHVHTFLMVPAGPLLRHLTCPFSV